MAPTQRSSSMVLNSTCPRLKSVSAYSRTRFLIVTVFATEPVIFGVCVPMNMNGAEVHATPVAALAAVVSAHFTFVAKPFASRSAENALRDQIPLIGYPTWFELP